MSDSAMGWEGLMPGSLKAGFARTAAITLWLVLPAYLVYIAAWTTFLQGVYIATVRDMYFNCMELVDLNYAYRMRPGNCKLDNLEYSSTMSHDITGFRNVRTETAPRVAVLGDSHAYGLGVNDGDTFAAILGRRTGVAVRK